ncbi:MAG: LysR family transcriptional regulator [Betaproteobacteria bacterium]
MPLTSRKSAKAPQSPKAPRSVKPNAEIPTTYPHISLDQWRALIAVIDAGSYARAADVLHKTQSSVTYAVQKIESLLKLKVFEIQGRRAVITEAGQVLYRRARTLVDEAMALERGAGSMAEGWQPELRIAAEIIFPTWLLLEAMAAFSVERPETRIELYETVLGGTDEAISQGSVDLAICSQVPVGHAGDPLMSIRAIAVAHPDHPLHKLGRAPTHRDLRHHRHIVIRDSGSKRTRKVSWEGAEQRWTVSNKATFIRALTMGLGFAWFPEDAIREELRQGLLKPLPLREGREFHAQLYLVFTDQEYAGRDTRRLAEILRERISSACAGDRQ